jgi:hypothetical protein
MDEIMNAQATTQTIEFSVWAIYGYERTIEAVVLLSAVVLIFSAGCLAYNNGKEIKGFVWCLGSTSILLFLLGVWRYGNENFKFHELFAMSEGNMGMSQHIYHGMQLEIYTPLIVSTTLSAVGVFCTMILGILDGRRKRA